MAKGTASVAHPFTDKEVQVMAPSYVCIEGGFPKINFPQLAALAGYSNPKSVSNVIMGLKKKIAAFRDSSAAASTFAAGPKAGSSGIPSSTGSSSSSPTSSRKRKGAASSAGDDTAVPVSSRGRLISRDARGTMASPSVLKGGVCGMSARVQDDDDSSSSSSSPSDADADSDSETDPDSTAVDEVVAMVDDGSTDGSPSKRSRTKGPGGSSDSSSQSTWGARPTSDAAAAAARQLSGPAAARRIPTNNNTSSPSDVAASDQSSSSGVFAPVADTLLTIFADKREEEKKKKTKKKKKNTTRQGHQRQRIDVDVKAEETKDDDSCVSGANAGGEEKQRSLNVADKANEKEKTAVVKEEEHEELVDLEATIVHEDIVVTMPMRGKETRRHGGGGGSVYSCGEMEA